MSEQLKYLRLRSDGINVTRYRTNKDNTGVTLYLDAAGKHTVADLLAAIEAGGGCPENTSFRGGCFRIELPSTPEDVARWEAADAKREEGARKSRRDWYERLRAEFETASEPQP